MGTPSPDTSRWVADRIFSAAWAYELAFSWDIADEVDVIIRLASIVPGNRLLMPACGTGRYAHALACWGFQVDASDIHPAMIDLALVQRTHPSLAFRVADMSVSLGDAPDRDAAITACNSLRYLLTDAEVEGHLSAVRQRLKPGGRYLVELGLNQTAKHVDKSAQWRISHPDAEVTARWTLTRCEPPTSVETAEIAVTWKDGRQETFVDEQPQRVWTRDDLVSTFAAAGLHADGFFLPDGRPHHGGAACRYYVRFIRE